MIVLDTHVLIWWVDGAEKPGSRRSYDCCDRQTIRCTFGDSGSEDPFLPTPEDGVVDERSQEPVAPKRSEGGSLGFERASHWVIPGSRLFLEFPVALALKGMPRDTIPTRQSGSPPG
jgi:hypothetical protein